jgi:hypothetical protein
MSTGPEGFDWEHCHNATLTRNRLSGGKAAGLSRLETGWTRSERAYGCWRSGLGGQTTAPHHLSGPPPPARTALEVSVTAPEVRAANTKMIANVVFISVLLLVRIVIEEGSQAHAPDGREPGSFLEFSMWPFSQDELSPNQPCKRTRTDARPSTSRQEIPS